MRRRWVYAFVVWSLCFGVARGNLTMAPLSSWSITGDFGDILALNGYPAERLMVGKTVYANPPGQSANEPADSDGSTMTTPSISGASL